MLTECEGNGTSEVSSGRSSTPNSPILSSTEQETAVIPGPAEEISKLRQEYEAEISRIKKEAQTKLKETNREKETVVMRYANSEMEILKLRKEIEALNKQTQNLKKEVESQNKKNKMLSTERERLINMVDAKVCDLQYLQKENEKLKDDNSSKDFKIKWTQKKLNAESEAHKEVQAKLEKCAAELAEALEEACRMRKDCRDMIESYTPDPEMCSNISCEPVTQSREETNESVPDSAEAQPLNPFQKEIEILKQKHRALIEENNSLSCRVQTLQENRLEMEQKASRLQESNADHLHQIASLQSDLASADCVRNQLLREQERVVSLQSECDQLRKCNADLLADMGVCRSKEAEFLAYTQQVTEKNVLLQSEFSSMEAKSLALEAENNRLLSRIEDLQNEVKLAEKSVLHEKKIAAQEKQKILKELEANRDKCLSLERQLEEVNGDMVQMKKKHETSLRELTKELKSSIREAKQGCNGAMDGISQSSRTSSSTSLNNMDAVSQRSSNEHESDPPVIPDQQVLVERIVKLQRLLAKKQEKNEFLEEHTKELRETAQRQKKIIQAYAMCQDAGAMTSDISDQNKVWKSLPEVLFHFSKLQHIGSHFNFMQQLIRNVIRAEFVKYGGIMGSLYASKPTDEGLTLELLLEINGKLQALLEDTLLKNITLKENLSTLGEENSKLTDRIKVLKGER